MINNKLIKVCGMRNSGNIQEIEILDVDMIGFIFYPKSSRYVYELPGYLPTHAKRVGVFVNENKDTISTIADRFSLDYLQLHGSESPECCRRLAKAGYKIIKALPIAHPDDLVPALAYQDSCHYLLFDTRCEQYGGSGNQFDWSILSAYQGEIPFLLSGGINLYSVKALKEFSHPKLAGYDINSRFETKPGFKDKERISLFLNELKDV